MRKYILEKRRALSKEEVFERSEKIIKDIDVMIQKNGDMVLLAYIPIGNEVDLRPLLERILSGYYKQNYDINITLGLPRVMGETMKFFEVKTLEKLEKSDIGIMEPKASEREIIAKHSHVLVPILGLNKDKKRLGFGAGYYDRYFKDKSNNIFYGIAYEFQIDLDFEAKDYDIAMDLIFYA